MDYETGKVLYQKNGNVKIYPASTTKAWTAYLVIKNVPDLNNHYTTAKDMALIARKCMSDSVFREIVATKSVKFKPTKQYPQTTTQLQRIWL